jgi:hypothetical protein
MQKQRRVWIGIVFVVAVLVPMGIALGTTRTLSVPGTRASCVDWAAVTSPTTTTSTTWTNVPGMVVKDTLAQNFSVQVSGTFDGNQPEVRVIDTSIGGSSPLDPGSTTVGVGSGPTAFSFTWVGQNPAEHQHIFRLQWRLGSSGSTTMENGDMSLIYQGAPTPATC